MSKRTILCIDDQREVLAALNRDLESFAGDLEIAQAESADEADELIQKMVQEGREIALIISDHIMPGENGVDFLARISKDDRFNSIKKVLLTGLATQQDTIRAINEAQIDAYLEKPWDQEQLIETVGRLPERLDCSDDPSGPSGAAWATGYPRLRTAPSGSATGPNGRPWHLAERCTAVDSKV